MGRTRLKGVSAAPFPVADPFSRRLNFSAQPSLQIEARPSLGRNRLTPLETAQTLSDTAPSFDLAKPPHMFSWNRPDDDLNRKVWSIPP